MNQILTPLKRFLKLFGINQHFIDLLIGMTEKELKARYKHTVFGFLWVFVNPLIQMLVIGFVFRFFIKEPINNYFLYLFTGLLLQELYFYWLILVSNYRKMTLFKLTSSILAKN